jgi:transmembrane sensor
MEQKNLEYWLSDEQFKRWVLNPTMDNDIFFARYLDEYPNEKKTLAKARLVLLHTQANHDTISEEEITKRWNRLQNARIISLKKPWYPSWQRIAVAASVVLVCGLAFYFWKNTQQTPIIYATNFNQTKTIFLPDSSEVVLNSNSQLTINSAWEEGSPREVWLKGEGYFKVKKKIQKNSFEVHTDKLNIKVLGTIFNIIARTSTNNVMLEEGKVQVKTKGFSDEIMKPNDLITWTDKGLEKSVVAAQDYNAWLRNQLVFNGMELEDVVQRLEDLYGVKIEVNPKLARKQFTAVLPSQDIDVVLDALVATFGLEKRVENGKFILE